MLLCGCVQAPVEATYRPGTRANDAEVNEIFWPSPPEVPRYRYVGLLVGEGNFVRSSLVRPGVGTQIFRWIVGIGPGRIRRPDNLLRPQAGMVDPAGKIYVTDGGRRAVFVFDMDGGTLNLWERADGGASFDTPVGIARQVDGTILVADAGLGRIVRLTAAGEPLGSFGKGLLGRPTGLAHEENLTYVADTADHDIKVFDLAGNLRNRIGRRGTGPGEFNGPTHLTLRAGRLYVSDTLNARVQVFTSEGEFIGIVGKRGLYVGNLTRPKGVSVDDDGNVYVVESYYDHLVIFDKKGRFLLPIGGTGAGIGDFFLPAGTWLDDRGRVFVADMYNRRVIIVQYLGE